ncbi:solanesyl diphosphate synthase [Candidatus Cyanaurora vandensis]|uniref:solanesyl diphosphate synthase n=1 Tax=Candidatus Cyanaurora vandensis TaxID=2714958 RepID=UPI00257B2DA7|nr:solanesyl diphosphate synthase [Candidatus Cyanaurora vandensis]
MVSSATYFALVEDDLEQLSENLVQLVGAKNPVLAKAAEYLFKAGGKHLRPALVMLAARATALDGEPTARHRRLAEITEMIHTASLVHDDVIDRASLRRQQPTVNALFGDKAAVLAGDFLFAKSSIYLARLRNLEVVELLSTIIDHFAEGEIRQMQQAFDPDLTFEDYLLKNFYKTGSLIANSCRAAAVLSEVSESQCQSLYDYGQHLGAAFQLVDDLLDFTATTETLGKPVASDLASGHMTAPVLYALVEYPELRGLIESQFEEPGSFEESLVLIHRSHGVEQTMTLAQSYAQRARFALEALPPSPARHALMEVTDYVLERVY